ncbi:unnamed protein product, partial [Prunus brigantina]
LFFITCIADSLFFITCIFFLFIFCSRSFIVMSSTATSSGKVRGGRGQNKRYWTTKEDNVE